MFVIAIALLLAAPQQPPETVSTNLCIHDAKTGLSSSRGYSNRDGSKVWQIRGETLTPLDAKRRLGSQAQPFSINNEPVVLKGRTYVKYGLPRVLSPADLNAKAHGLYFGTPFFIEKDTTAADVLYALHAPVGCEFQPYQLKR